MKRYIILLKIVEESIDNLISSGYDDSKSDLMRQKLTWNSNLHLGKASMKEQINTLSSQEVDKLFSNYEVKVSGHDGKVFGEFYH